MTCKDCLHYDVCMIVRRNGEDRVLANSPCNHFLSSTDVQEIKHGFWISISNDDKWGLCSNCGLVVHMEGNYKFEGCPHCLTLMDQKEREG